MSVKVYRVVFQGLLLPEAEFRGQMTGLGVEPGSVDRMLARAPIAMKQGLTLGQARQYADAVQAAGGRVAIEEHGRTHVDPSAPARPAIRPLRQFTMCPQCGLKQLKTGSCERCGCPLE